MVSHLFTLHVVIELGMSDRLVGEDTSELLFHIRHHIQMNHLYGESDIAYIEMCDIRCV